MEEKKVSREDMEVGKGLFKLDNVTPAKFEANVTMKLTTSIKLARQFAEFFYSMSDDVAGCIVDIDQMTKRVACYLYLQNSKFTNEKKFKAVVQSNMAVRGSSIIDRYTNTYKAQNTIMSLTDDAKNVFQEFLPFSAPRKNKGGNVWVPIWEQIYSEKVENKNPYGINPAAVYNYGVIQLDPNRILAKMYGEKPSENDYFEYEVFPMYVMGTYGVQFPNYILSISQGNGETIRKVCNEIGFSMQNDLGIVTPF